MMNKFTTIEEDKSHSVIELGKSNSTCIEQHSNGEIEMNLRFGKYQVTLSEEDLEYANKELRHFKISLTEEEDY